MKMPVKYRYIMVLTAITVILLLLLALVWVINSATTGKVPIAAYISISVSILLVIYIAVIAYRITGNDLKTHYINEHLKQQQEELRKQKENEKQTDNPEETTTEQEVTITLEHLEKQILPQKKYKYLDSYIEKVLINLGKVLEISHGAFFTFNKEKNIYQLTSRYAVVRNKNYQEIKPGEGITGQVIKNKKTEIIEEIPDDYLYIESGLGKSKPAQLIIMPVINDNEVIAVLEFATLKKLNKQILDAISELSIKLGKQLGNFETR